MTEHGKKPRDYYEILGVLRTSKPSDITAAYYELARKFHPDVGTTDTESLAKFKLVSEAYEVLSDVRRRRAYDWKCQPRPAAGSSAVTHASPAKPFFSDWKPTPPTARLAPGDIEVELPISPEEAAHGGPCDFTLNLYHVCGKCDGRGQTRGNSCDACQGTGRTQERRRLLLTLPRDVKSDTVIRITGQGKRAETAHGDLLVRFRIQPSW